MKNTAVNGISKWLNIIFWKTIIVLIAVIPLSFAGNAAGVLTQILAAVNTLIVAFCLIKCAPADKGFMISGILTIATFLSSCLMSVFTPAGTAVLSALLTANGSAAGTALQALTLLISVIGNYYEFSALRRTTESHDAKLSKKWKNMFIWIVISLILLVVSISVTLITTRSAVSVPLDMTEAVSGLDTAAVSTESAGMTTLSAVALLLTSFAGIIIGIVTAIRYMVNLRRTVVLLRKAEAK